MRTIVVTGACGFVGRHVSQIAAKNGHRVIGIGHGEWTEDEWQSYGISVWHELDITVASLVAHAERPHAIIHCAGSGSVGFSMENPAQDFDRSAGTTLSVLEYIRTCTPSTKMVYPSSAAVYGRAAQLPINEDAPLTPVSPYGVHKKIAEDICRSYGQNFGVQIAIVRIFSAYGPELRKQLLWDACQKLGHGHPIFGGTGKETRDWIHIADVAKLLLMAIDCATSEVLVINGATGIEISTDQILQVLFEALGSEVHPSFSGSTRSGDPDRYLGDPTRAKTLGWAPDRCWKDGIAEYAEWFRGNFS